MTTTYTHRTLTRNERIAINHAVRTNSAATLDVWSLGSVELRLMLAGAEFGGVIETEGKLLFHVHGLRAIRVEDVDSLVAAWERTAS